MHIMCVRAGPYSLILSTKRGNYFQLHHFYWCKIVLSTIKEIIGYIIINLSSHSHISPPQNKPLKREVHRNGGQTWLDPLKHLQWTYTLQVLPQSWMQYPVRAFTNKRNLVQATNKYKFYSNEVSLASLY